MHFYDEIKKIANGKDVMLFIDMDGVIAAYSIGKNPYDFLNKRPLKQNIANIEEASKISNVETHILSICRENNQIEEKNIWLDKYASFFKKENRNIIARADEDWKTAREIKFDFLKNIKTDKQIVLVDDDNEILKYVHQNLNNVIVMQDSELVD